MPHHFQYPCQKIQTVHKTTAYDQLLNPFPFLSSQVSHNFRCKTSQCSPLQGRQLQNLLGTQAYSPRILTLSGELKSGGPLPLHSEQAHFLTCAPPWMLRPIQIPEENLKIPALRSLLGTQAHGTPAWKLLPGLLLWWGVSEHHAVQGGGVSEGNRGPHLQQGRQGSNGGPLKMQTSHEILHIKQEIFGFI